MIAPRVLPLCILAAPMALAQIGIYGPVTAHIHAGDPAPDIVYSRILSSPTPNSWSAANLSGQLTVLVFYPDTSDNPQSVTRWNATVDKFAGQNVQFVWITRENEAKLLPWLEKHPVKGWVLYDARGETGRAYGMDWPETVIIGPDRDIVGFSRDPEIDEVLKAAQEGRTSTTRPTPQTMREFQERHLVAIDAEPFRMPRMDDHRPTFAPSYVLHVTPGPENESGNFGGPDFYVLQGYTLQLAISEAYHIGPHRMVLPTSLDDGKKKYTFSMLVPQPEDHQKILEQFQQGLADQFHFTAVWVEREVDAYVVTAVPGRTPPRFQPPESGFAGGRGSSVGWSGPLRRVKIPRTLRPSQVLSTGCATSPSQMPQSTNSAVSSSRQWTVQ